MAPYSLGFPTDFGVPALVAVAAVLVVAATTKVGYPLWAIGGMIFLYVLYLAVRRTNLSRVSRDNLDENGGGNQSLKRRPVAKV